MKERLDVLLVQRGHAASREKAKAVIMQAVSMSMDRKKTRPDRCLTVRQRLKCVEIHCVMSAVAV